MTTGRLAGRVAIVTGSGRGIGRAIALAYAAEGASLVLVARSADELRAVESEARAIGARAITSVADVTVVADVERSVAAAIDAFGAVDILVNNAGVGQGLAGKPITTLLDVDPAMWDAVFAVNCRGPFLFMRAVLPVMLARRSGSIINISSRLAYRAVPGSAPYGPSKAALTQLTVVAAAESASQGIRANVLHPGGPVDTGIFTAHYRPGDTTQIRPPDIIAPAAVWLASDEASSVTGQVIDCREWNASRHLPT